MPTKLKADRDTHRQRVYYGINLAVFAGCVGLLLAAQGLTATSAGVSLAGRSIPDLCLNKRVLGRPCPGCGLTRGTIEALQGRWGEAGRLHPSGPWLAAYLIAQALLRGVLLLARPSGSRVRVADLTVSLVGLAAVVHVPM